MSLNTKDERELLSKPGDTILETLEHIKMSQAQLAERMGKSSPKINDIISGKEPITMTTALALEKVLGITAQFWLNREQSYREKLARLDELDAYDACMDWLKIQPIKELKKIGFLKSQRIGPDMVGECLQFYGVASPKQWEAVYVDQYTSTSFRKSNHGNEALGSIAAWLRIGELALRQMQLPEYDKEKFKASLLEVLELVREQPEDFATQLQAICGRAGVAVIYTMCLPQAPLNGAVRWFGGRPLMQLTDRYKVNDSFWFTFFHEAGHILLHGKKDVFIENFAGYQLDKEKEKEADQFASKQLLPDSILDEVDEGISVKEIKLIARKYRTHPAIVLGRLQHHKIVPYTFGGELKEKVSFENNFFFIQ